MSRWNADHYLKFGDERTRPALDLALRINLSQPRTIVDLGCGPGNSTQVLRERWPESDIVGLDNSPEMIESARQAYPDHQWQLANIADWNPTQPIDLVYSNAVLMWLPNHAELIPRLLHSVAPGGAMAFQIPSRNYATVRTIIHDISRDSCWTDRMEGPRNAMTMEQPSFYYDVLVKQTRELDIWETEYYHVIESTDAIVDWIASTGLRPFLAALEPDEEHQNFMKELSRRVHDSYETRVDGKVLYPFRRTFVIAYR